MHQPVDHIWSPCCACVRAAGLEANLGEGYLDDLASVSAEELNAIGAFYASKSAASVLHGAHQHLGRHALRLLRCHFARACG